MRARCISAQTISYHSLPLDTQPHPTTKKQTSPKENTSPKPKDDNKWDSTDDDDENTEPSKEPSEEVTIWWEITRLGWYVSSDFLKLD